MEIHNIFLFFTACFAALFPVIDPIGSGLIINGYYGNISEDEKKQYTRKIVINSVIIGLVSLLAGHLILLIFGLAIPVIQIAGGFIILKSGYDWLNSPDVENPDKVEELSPNKSHIESKLFYPLSFPISMGPGTISVIFTLMATAEIKGEWLYTGVNYIVIGIAMFLQLVILYFVTISGSRISKRLGREGNMIINKLIAFITFCIGLQIMITGISKTFHLSIL